MQLISATEVISQAFLPQEIISPASITPNQIDIAQQRYIRPRFGDEMFDEFFEGKHATFVEQYIAPALAYYVRASIIDYLSVQISDQGALVYDESYKAQNDKQGSVISQESIDTTANNNDEEETTESTNSKDVLVKELETESLNFVTTTEPVVNITSVENTIDATDETNSTETKTGSATKNSTATSSNIKKTDTSAQNVESTNENLSHETLKAASYSERRLLIFRALNDASTLIAKAVRYVEKHTDEFPNYEPINLSSRIFF